MPPLRERIDDIPLLVERFLSRFAREPGKAGCNVSDEAIDLLTRYTWPGNVRELQSTLKQAMIQATGPILLPEFLSAALRGPAEAVLAGSAAPDSPTSQLDGSLDGFIGAHVRAGTQSLHADLVAHVERVFLDHVFRYTEGNLSRAAEILGIRRGSQGNKIRHYGIQIVQSVSLEHGPGEAEVTGDKLTA